MVKLSIGKENRLPIEPLINSSEGISSEDGIGSEVSC